MMQLGGLVLGLFFVACSDGAGADEKRLAALHAAVARFDDDLSKVEPQVRSLSASWSRLAEGYDKLTATYQAARRDYEEAQRAANTAHISLKAATEHWKSSQMYWELYREIVLLAVKLDLEGFSSSHLKCEPMSTATFRKLLISQGIDLTGKDIDHIVPRDLGGADDLANYQVLDSSLNRSLGKSWNIEKCLMAGRRRCTEAVAASARCGSYQGGGFW